MRPCSQFVPPKKHGFNPRTHTGCDSGFPFYFIHVCCFNPRTHTGCDLSVCGVGVSPTVSIHAPTRGATLIQWIASKGIEVSIHAPTRGATPDVGGTAANKAFQSTHPHGVRRAMATRSKYGTGFNPRTHTGCDYSLTVASSNSLGFNPRTHTGCDLPQTCIPAFPTPFQSTHPHGVRLVRSHFLLFFNSVSIHAPTRGATRGLTTSYQYRTCFNPRTHTGCDLPGAPLPMDGELSFNPRTHTGCDLSIHCFALYFPGFNPRTHTGCDSVQSYIL